MDGTTEPIIVVIGHPIAGNPSQLAVERSLESLEMDWRVLSFDVHPSDVAAALEGFLVTGIAGVLIDASVRREASRWYQSVVDRLAEDGAEDEPDAAGEPVGDDQTIADDQPVASGETTSDGTDDVDADGDDSSEVSLDASSDNGMSDNAEDGPPIVDCLSRDEGQRFVGGFQEREWIEEIIADHPVESRLCLGRPEADGCVDPSRSGSCISEFPPQPEAIERASVIFLAGGTESHLEPEDWPEPGDRVVIDLTQGHHQEAVLRRRGYRVVTALERRIGTLRSSIRRWVDRDVPDDVIRDAIEEYLGV